jgi:hypothetical protein
VDATAHYRNLVGLGRAEFLASAAPAALVRYRTGGSDLAEGGTTLTLDQDASETVEETRPQGKDFAVVDETDLEVYPLAKKPGASFPDRITIGRTPNNDIVIVDHSVSRFHAYLRLDGKSWVVADAGSKNGSWLGSATLEPRKERQVPSKTIVRIGDVDLTFYLAPDLYAALGGSR